MINVTLENFEAQVIQASLQTPVLIDFWAPWCEPCKTLGPLLEKVEAAYAGRFILAKVDIDAQPQLAQAFGIRSVPTVILLSGGRPVDGFAGALPEGQIKSFLDKHLPSEEEVQAQENIQQAAQMAKSGNADAALAQFRDILQANPNDALTRCQYVELLLQTHQTDLAREAWQPLASLLTAGGAMAARPAALEAWIKAQENEAQMPSVDTLEQAIAADKRNFAARFELAQHWFAMDERVKALDELLEIIMRDKNWQDAVARKTYIAILELMSAVKPASSPTASGKQSTIALERQVQELDPQQKLVADYRRRLSMALN